jgi:hypothetical protein
VINFQLDECISAGKLLSHCRRQNACVPFPFPKILKGKSVKDPEVLGKYMPLDRVLVTVDLSIVEKHGGHIPEANPGLIMLGPSPDSPYTTTVRLTMKMLAKLKAAFPDWHNVSWRNSIVRLTESSIEVGHMTTSGYVYDLNANLDDPNGWQDTLAELLRRNASGPQLLP